MNKQVVSRKPVKQVIEKVPAVGELFFDQFKRIPGKVVSVLSSSFKVQFRSGDLDFRFREVEWDSRAGWWVFKEEKKEYHVWMEIVSAETSGTRKGVWEKAASLPMTETTARALEKLLKLENPELDFAVSIGKPSSYFI